MPITIAFKERSKEIPLVLVSAVPIYPSATFGAASFHIGSGFFPFYMAYLKIPSCFGIFPLLLQYRLDSKAHMWLAPFLLSKKVIFDQEKRFLSALSTLSATAPILSERRW